SNGSRQSTSAKCGIWSSAARACFGTPRSSACGPTNPLRNVVSTNRERNRWGPGDSHLQPRQDPLSRIGHHEAGFRRVLPTDRAIYPVAHSESAAKHAAISRRHRGRVLFPEDRKSVV